MGEIVYFTMSRWDRGEDMGISYDKPYNVYIMEARLRSADRTVERLRVDNQRLRTRIGELPAQGKH